LFFFFFCFFLFDNVFLWRFGGGGGVLCCQTPFVTAFIRTRRLLSWARCIRSKSEPLAVITTLPSMPRSSNSSYRQPLVSELNMHLSVSHVCYLCRPSHPNTGHATETMKIVCVQFYPASWLSPNILLSILYSTTMSTVHSSEGDQLSDPHKTQRIQSFALNILTFSYRRLSRTILIEMYIFTSISRDLICFSIIRVRNSWNL